MTPAWFDTNPAKRQRLARCGAGPRHTQIQEVIDMQLDTWLRPLILLMILAFGSSAAETKKNAAPTPAPRVDFSRKIHLRSQEQYWLNKVQQRPLTRKILTQSIELARAYYLNHQNPEGNFVYLRDLIADRAKEDDSQIRQAGAIWGLSCLNRDRHTDATRHAIVRGIDFWFRCSQPLKCGLIGPVYPGDDEIKTGTVALVSLAIIELWRGQEEYLTGLGRGLYSAWLDTYLTYLQGMEMDNGSWASSYAVTANQRDGTSSPYYDGETLLAYCKAARYMDHKELIPKIERIAPLLAERYTIQAWRSDPDSDDCKGFFQWGCMAFAEYVEADWEHADLVGDAALALAWWQIHLHEVETRRGNTGYAVEGLLGAYRVARARGDHAAMQSIRQVCERLLSKLISWQIGGPLARYNPFLRTLRTPEDAKGGIMSTQNSGLIRIDIVQHQVHAMLMALKLFYPE